MKYDYIDIHSHLNFPNYEKDFEAVIERLRETKTATIVVGTDFASSKKAVELAEKYEMIYACIGLHPADNRDESFDALQFEKLMTHPKVVAVGECGLDYGKEGVLERGDKERQKRDFEVQIDFAVRHNKPLMLHVRNAHRDVLDILSRKKKLYAEKLTGNSHFFSGDIAIAEEYIKLGFTISFTGVITFTHAYDEVVKDIPLEYIMSETDSPFVAPVPFRGTRNEPAHVIEVVRRIAELKNRPFEEVAETIRKNTEKYFGV